MISIAPSPIYNAPGEYAARSTPVIHAQILDAKGGGVPLSSLSLLTLTIMDSSTGQWQVFNGVDQDDILNTGRGAVDDQGNLTLSLLANDTAVSGASRRQRIQRAFIIDWISGAVVGRFQINLTIRALAEP